MKKILLLSSLCLLFILIACEKKELNNITSTDLSSEQTSSFDDSTMDETTNSTDLSEETTNSTNSLDETTNSTDSSEETTNSTDSSEETTQGETDTMKIKLTINQESAIVDLLENDAVTDFISMLPLTLTFEDYNHVEKISILPRELTLGSAPTSCDPDVGTFAYYAPWGNLSIFYNDFRISNNLIPLGVFESGIDIFAAQENDFTVTIELIKE